MKKILVIDETQLVRDFLERKLRDYAFDVSLAVSGLDGAVKLRTELPDLVIVDYHLRRKPIKEFLKEKQRDKNTAAVPVIVASKRTDRRALLEVAPYNVKKVLTKPLKVDALLSAVGEVLDTKVEIDTTACIIEAHVNDDLLLIEVAQGLNREKVDLLRYKIQELLVLYGLSNPKVLVIMTSIEISTADSIKLNSLFTTILETTGSTKKRIRVLTRSEYVQQFLSSRTNFAGVTVVDSLETAMDNLFGKSKEPADSQLEGLISGGGRQPSKAEAINLKFATEASAHSELAEVGKTGRIVVVDDDPTVIELVRSAFADTSFEFESFANGKEFVDSSAVDNADLILLDLNMPIMGGFEVLQHLDQPNARHPIIILSALSKRETVLQALELGVTSYLTKPIQPSELRNKTAEILQLNF